ncbi:hypothetical protein [Polaromonas sp. C04]|uniref:hypothetical protein n=1 Tax=Polaromonas sp. C04 TaxID=1945857 RepID=UPI00118600DA|nr:hypothetical protein [Polaromonas sp. C04]
MVMPMLLKKRADMPGPLTLMKTLARFASRATAGKAKSGNATRAGHSNGHSGLKIQGANDQHSTQV